MKSNAYGGIMDVPNGARNVTGLNRAYQTWKDMLKRCYSENAQKKNPTYIGCSVCDEWKYYSNFKEFYNANYVEGFQLDKDILIEGNKVYSPDTCVFVPSRINSLLNSRKSARGKYPIGVDLRNDTGKFRASCMVDGKQKCIGVFETIDEAFTAYVEAKKCEVARVVEDALANGEITRVIANALLSKRIKS